MTSDTMTRAGLMAGHINEFVDTLLTDFTSPTQIGWAKEALKVNYAIGLDRFGLDYLRSLMSTLRYDDRIPVGIIMVLAPRPVKARYSAMLKKEFQ